VVFFFRIVLLCFVALIHRESQASEGELRSALRFRISGSAAIVVFVSHYSLKPNSNLQANVRSLILGSELVLVEALPQKSAVANFLDHYPAEVGNNFSNLNTKQQSCILDLTKGWFKTVSDQTEIVNRLSEVGLLRLVNHSPTINQVGSFHPGLDFMATVIARELGVSVVELEGVEQAFLSFSKIPRQDILGELNALCLLYSTEKGFGSAREHARKIFEAYSSNVDFESLVRETRSYQETVVKYPSSELLVSQYRNKLMAENLLGMMRKINCVVAFVGGAHSVGPDSLQNEFIKLGGRVEKTEKDATPCSIN
jgi:TraB/PrgY/gumN family